MENTKSQTTTRKAGTRKAAGAAAPKKRAPRGGQQQAAAPSATDALKNARNKLGGSAKQSGDQPQGSQGASSNDSTGAAPQRSAGQPTTGEIRGGTKQVLIEVTKLPGRGGRPSGPEEYPFGDLKPAKKVGGEIVGESFFIPASDNPESQLATARKRHRPSTFWSRMTMENVDGVQTKGYRFWKAATGS